MAWPACGTTPSVTAAARWPTPSPPRCAPWPRTPRSTRSPTSRQRRWPRSCARSPRRPNARVFFTSSGSEAIDTVMKLARIAHVQAGQPQRKLIISRTRGYHGVAYGGTSAQGIAPNKENFGPFVDEVVQVPAEDVEAVATLMSQRGNEVAAIITEPVQGAGGVYPAPDGYLQSLRKLCDQHGAYLIFDEVITGYGRTGSWFAAHHYGVPPTSPPSPRRSPPATSRSVASSSAPPRRPRWRATPTSSSATASPTPATQQPAPPGSRTWRSSAARAWSNGPSTLGSGWVAGCRHWPPTAWSNQRPRPRRGVGGDHAPRPRCHGDARPHARQWRRHRPRRCNDSLVMCPPLVIRDEHLDRIVDSIAAAAG